MHHTVNILDIHGIQHRFDNRCVRSRWAQNQLTHSHTSFWLDVGELVLAAVYERLGHARIKTFRILARKVLCEHIVTRRCQSIRSHATIILSFVRSLPERRQTDDDVARANVVVTNHVCAAHTSRHRGIHHHSANQVPQICRLSSRGLYANTTLTQGFQNVLRTADERAQHIPRNERLVATNRTRHENIIHASNTKQIISIHHNRVLRNSPPHAHIASFLPIHVRQRRLCPRAIRVHARAVPIIPSNVLHNLTKRLGKQPFINLLNRRVHVLLRCAHTSRGVALIRPRRRLRRGRHRPTNAAHRPGPAHRRRRPRRRRAPPRR
mmetsp:Transcript_4600/g.15265  ORF Transcript_4600/g.15265 Transcript_4600/m.15265 type:complete len:323 (+) Transcript_4600:1111-2079(+)